MPSLGADMDEGKLVEWLKHPGEVLKRGDIIAVVETQKGAIEIEVFHDGVLEQTHAAPGATLPVGSLLATIRTPGEVPAVQVQAAPVPIPQPVAAVTPQPVPSQAKSRIEAPGQFRITPAARTMAARSGIDLEHVLPGSDGIIGLREIARLPQQPRKRYERHRSRRDAQGDCRRHGTQQARDSALLCWLGSRHDGDGRLAEFGERQAAGA